MSVKVDETEHLLHPEAELSCASPAAGLLDLHKGCLDLGIRSSGDESFVPLSCGQVGLIGVEDVLEDAATGKDVEVYVGQVSYWGGELGNVCWANRTEVFLFRGSGNVNKR